MITLIVAQRVTRLHQSDIDQICQATLFSLDVLGDFFVVLVLHLESLQSLRPSQQVPGTSGDITFDLIKVCRLKDLFVVLVIAREGGIDGCR